VRTIDTGRLVPFHWPSILFRAVPPIDTTENLFKMSTFVLRDLAVPMAMANARYERISELAVVAVAAKLDCINAFVRSQVLQDSIQRASQPIDDDDDGDDDEGDDLRQDPNAPLNPAIREEAKQLKLMWEQQGSANLLRSFTHAVFRIRGELDSPFAILYSLPDKDFVLVHFWHGELMQPFVKTQPLFAKRESLLWPILDHSVKTASPEVLCSRPSCTKSSGPPTTSNTGVDAALVMASFERHLSSKDNERKREVTPKQ